MFDEEALVKKYGKANANQILEVYKNLRLDFADKVNLIKDAEDMAAIIVGLKLDYVSVCASMIFPFILDNTHAVLRYQQNTELFQMLNMLLKCEEFANSYVDADGLKNMLIAIAKDIRVIIIKTAQILVFARKNVLNRENANALQVFNAIDDVFAPISARLGLSEIKSELQDLSFEFHNPDEFYKLKTDIKNETRANVKMMNDMVSEIRKLLDANGIEAKCYGRIKHISSINNKLKDNHHTLKNIYDIAAARILVKNVSECYVALGIVHSSFVPVDGRFKDYIAHPKPNGYKSLHTTVYFQDEFFEVQIRTLDMHEFAEYGVAAHFLYKENKSSLNGLDNKLLWIRKLLEDKENVSSEKLLQELKTDVYLGEIFVQTPRGKVIKLVESATPIDFAYAIHSDVGNMCVGAKVNGAMAPLTTPLSNGDVVEILTNQNSKGPSRDWLKIAKCQSTKDKINAFYKRQMKQENIKLGKSMLENSAKANDVSFASLMQDNWVDIILKKHAFLSVEELFAAVGYGSITAEKVIKRLMHLKAQEDEKSKTILDVMKSPVKIENNTDIIGVQGALTKYCKCCNPIPGDEITGYVSRGRGVIIHKKSCENIPKLQASRFINVDWNENSNNDYSFTSIVDLVAKNSGNVYLEITNALSLLSIRVISLNSATNKNGELLLKIGLLVKDRNQLLQIKNKLASLGSVYEVL